MEHKAPDKQPDCACAMPCEARMARCTVWGIDTQQEHQAEAEARCIDKNRDQEHHTGCSAFRLHQQVRPSSMPD
jgi:hypothetical protein